MTRKKKPLPPEPAKASRRARGMLTRGHRPLQDAKAKSSEAGAARAQRRAAACDGARPGGGRGHLRARIPPPQGGAKRRSTHRRDEASAYGDIDLEPARTHAGAQGSPVTAGCSTPTSSELAGRNGAKCSPSSPPIRSSPVHQRGDPRRDSVGISLSVTPAAAPNSTTGSPIKCARCSRSAPPGERGYHVQVAVSLRMAARPATPSRNPI